MSAAALHRAALAATLLGGALGAPGGARAGGFLELSLGAAHPLGGALEGGLGLGGQLLLGLGGQVKGRAHGTALFGYVAVSLDNLEQRASAPLRGELSRLLATPAAGARLYWLVAPSTRLWVDLGAGVVYDSAEVRVEGLEGEAQRLSSSALALTGAAGLQYKLRPRVLLSAGYYAALPLEDDAALAERALRTRAATAAWGRGRVGVGVAWSF